MLEGTALLVGLEVELVGEPLDYGLLGLDGVGGLLKLGLDSLGGNLELADLGGGLLLEGVDLLSELVVLVG